MDPSRMSFDTGRIFRRPPPGTLGIMVATAALSLAALASAGRYGTSALAQALLFSPGAVLDAHRLWTPLTYLFVSLQPFQLIFYVFFGLWMFAAQLERQWGTRRFLYFFFVTGVSAAVVTALLGTFSSSLRATPPVQFDGTWVAFEAVVLGWVLMNWNATVLFFFIPVRAPLLIVFALLFPLIGIVQGNWEPFVPVLAAMAIGYLMLVRKNPLKKLWLRARLTWAEASLKRSRRHLRVVERDEGEGEAPTRQKDPPEWLN